MASTIVFIIFAIITTFLVVVIMIYILKNN